MKVFLKNKKGADWKIIFAIIILLVVLSILLTKSVPFIKDFFDNIRGISDPYEACQGEDDLASCKAKGIDDGICLNSQCVAKNRPALNLDHAKLIFRTTFKNYVERCSDKGGNYCTDASDAIENILSYVDNKDRGKVFIIIHNMPPEKTEFQLHKTGTFWSREKSVAINTYRGNICLLKKNKDGKFITENRPTGTIGIGREVTGVDIFFPEKLKVGYEGEGDFISLNHQDGDKTKPLCVHYTSFK